MSDMDGDLDSLLQRREEAERQRVAQELLLRRRAIPGVRTFIRDVATPVLEEVRDALQRNKYNTEMVLADEEVAIRFQMTALPNLSRLQDVYTYKVGVRGDCAEAILFVDDHESAEDWTSIVHHSEGYHAEDADDASATFIVDITKDDVIVDFKRRFFGSTPG